MYRISSASPEFCRRFYKKVVSFSGHSVHAFFKQPTGQTLGQNLTDDRIENTWNQSSIWV